MKVFTNIKGLGPIYCELMLIATDYADLFIAKDINKKRYIAMILNDEQDYLLSLVTNNILLKFLSSEISMRDAILRANNHYILHLEQYPIEGTFVKVATTELTDNQLPDKGVCLGFSNNCIKSFISSVKSEKTIIKSTVLRISPSKHINVPKIVFPGSYKPAAYAKSAMHNKKRLKNNHRNDFWKIGVKTSERSKININNNKSFVARTTNCLESKTTRRINTNTKRGRKNK